MFTRNHDCSVDSSCSAATATTKQTVLFLLFTLFWSSLTLLSDYFMVYRAAKQIQSNGFPSVKGMVTRSESHRTGSGKGGQPMMSIGLTFDFKVGDKTYSGSQYRFGSNSTGFDARYASSVVQPLPVGREVEVFYNPTDPQDCVLSRGLDGSDLCLAMFLMPFTLFMFGLWAGLWHLVRSFLARRVPEGISEWVVSDDVAPTTSALALLAVASFLMTFVVVIPFGFHPPMLIMQVVWLILISSSIITYFVVSRKQSKVKHCR